MKYYTLVSLIFTFLSTATTVLQARSLLMGTIEIAKRSTTHPIRVYHRGGIIPSHVQGTNSAKVTFDITKNNDQNRFFILIVEEFSHRSLDIPEQEECKNTVDYLCTCNADSYKFFVLDLVQDEQDNKDQSVEAFLKTQQPTYHWQIHEEKLPDTCAIPDANATIIIYYFPHAVVQVKGGSHLELPTIYMDDSLLANNSDQESHDDALIKLQLAAINTDALHAPSKRKIKEHNHRLLIMDVA